MGIIIKPERDRDMYVEWPTVVDVPTAHGDRAEMLRILHADPQARRHAAPEQRLTQADKVGSSSQVGEFWWDDDVFVFRQDGMLARRDLVRAVELLAAGRDDEVLALLAPFDDDEDNTEEAE